MSSLQRGYEPTTTNAGYSSEVSMVWLTVFLSPVFVILRLYSTEGL